MTEIYFPTDTPAADATVTNLRSSKRQQAADAKREKAAAVIDATLAADAKPADKPVKGWSSERTVAVAPAPAAKAPAAPKVEKAPAAPKVNVRQALDTAIVSYLWEANMDRIRVLAGVPELTDDLIANRIDHHAKYLPTKLYADGQRVAK
jgi:hypothetical protein